MTKMNNNMKKQLENKLNKEVNGKSELTSLILTNKEVKFRDKNKKYRYQIGHFDTHILGINSINSKRSSINPFLYLKDLFNSEQFKNITYPVYITKLVSY
jgi:hypothetical protein